VRYLLSVPPFTDPATVVDLATTAEASGWDGFFLWDHLRWDDIQEIHDPWVLLGAIAQATERMLLGTMVTPLSRRRPWVVAKHLVTLDHLSGGAPCWAWASASRQATTSPSSATRRTRGFVRRCSTRPSR
jgi:alkanesulfonate monooxygenase SsuD/methylene tetrahydromethanopterin reductase-like flavin-dependent oxidoreductase (luciferase family)